MFCNNCGKEINSEWNACPYCGEKNENCLQQSPVPPAQNIPVQPSYDQPGYNQNGYAPMNVHPPKKKSKLPIIITALVLVVAIVLGVIFVPGLLKGDDKDNDGDNGEKDTVTVWVISKVRCIRDSSGNSIEGTYTYSDDYKTVNYEYASTKGTEYFDESGKLKKSEYVYNPEQSINQSYRYLYSYDNEGRLIKREIHNLKYNSDVEITEYTYNDNGDRMNYWNDDIYGGEYIVFDSEGYIAERETLLSDGERADWRIYTYEKDKNGNITYIEECEGTVTNVYVAYELEYTSIEVSPEEAQFFKAQQKNLIEFNVIR